MVDDFLKFQIPRDRMRESFGAKVHKNQDREGVISIINGGEYR